MSNLANMALFEVNDAVSLLKWVIVVYLVIDILFTKNDPHVCLGWLLGTVLFPIVTFVLYILVSVKPRLKMSLKPSSIESKQVSSTVERFNISRLDSPDFEYVRYSKFFNWMESAGQSLFVGRNSIKLLKNSDEVYPEIFKEIEKAQKYIAVQFYQIQADPVGFKFLDTLTEQTKRGVKVYVLFDALGSFTLKPALVKEYLKCGLKIRRFFEIHPIKRRFQINSRNHRKLVVIDGEVAFVGGFNIGQLYLQGPDPARPSWVDLLYKIQGEAVSVLVDQFKSDWKESTGKSDSQIGSLEALFASKVDDASPVLGLIHSGPGRAGARFYEAVIQALLEAQSEILIMTPYFVPDLAILRCLKIAISRGVKIELTIPLKSNHEITDLCSSSFFKELLSIGVVIKRYAYGVCHGKILIVDNTFVLSGSSNLDYRSFFLNFETDLVIIDEKFAKGLTQFVRSIESSCEILRIESIQKTSFITLLAQRFVRLFAPLM